MHRTLSTGTAASAWRYTFSVDPGVTVLRGTVCFDGPAPGLLIAGGDAAWEHLLRAEVLSPSGPVALPHDAHGIALAGVSAGGCVRWETALALPVDRPGYLGVRTAEGSVVASSNLWLWFPAERSPGALVTARFELPTGLFVSVPWPREPGPGEVYRLDPTVFTREGYLGLGTFPVETVTLPGAVLSVGRYHAPDPRPWVAASAALVTELYGTFPADRAQLLFVGQDDATEPVPFAFTSHAGDDAVLFLLDPRASAAALAGDGTATHEFVHLGQPVMRDDDAWLVEGLAVYYEQVLRARAGLVSPQSLWTYFHRGFARGRADHTGRTLAQDAAALRQDNHYGRVYWGGVAIMLLADVDIRTRSSGARSLDDVARAVFHGCRDRARTWTADSVLPVMDTAAGGAVLSTLAARYVHSETFPDLDGVYSQLGIRASGDGVTLASEGARASLREAITAPRGSPRELPAGGR